MPIKPSTLSTCAKGHFLRWHTAGRRRRRQNFDTYGLGDKAHRLPVSEVINNYQRSEVIDPLTVKFYFNKPSPGFLQEPPPSAPVWYLSAPCSVILKSWAMPDILSAPAPSSCRMKNRAAS
nr:ABC transporter substrate binding protein, KPN_01854 family [Klebsiella pneumoniae]